jgi:hypothetical protein
MSTDTLNELYTHSRTFFSLNKEEYEDIMLSELIQLQKDRFYVILLIRGV